MRQGRRISDPPLVALTLTVALAACTGVVDSPAPTPTALQGYAARIRIAASIADATLSDLSTAENDAASPLRPATSASDINSLEKDAAKLEAIRANLYMTPPLGHIILRRDVAAMLDDYINGLKTISSAYTVHDPRRLDVGINLYDGGKSNARIVRQDLRGLP